MGQRTLSISGPAFREWLTHGFRTLVLSRRIKHLCASFAGFVLGGDAEFCGGRPVPRVGVVAELR